MSHSYPGEYGYMRSGCTVPESKLKIYTLKGSFYVVTCLLLEVNWSLALLISLTFLSIARNQIIPQRLEAVILKHVGNSGIFRSRICQEL